MPIVVGVMPGIPRSGPNKEKGFSSGSHYPVGEPTTSRLHRNYKIDETVIGTHNNNVDENVTTADGSSWSEPKSQYNAKIPYNRVIETVSGHVFELDDTPGAERIHLSHKSNTFFEIAPDGSKVTKVSGKNYEIFMDDNNVHIKGLCNITVEGNANIYVKGDTTQKNDGNFIGSASSFTFNGGTTINGDVAVNGMVTASGDVIGGGISLDQHVHGGVRSGPSTTLGPQ
jgi:phage baseplate assembly protein gpV